MIKNLKGIYELCLHISWVERDFHSWKTLLSLQNIVYSVHSYRVLKDTFTQLCWRERKQDFFFHLKAHIFSEFLAKLFANFFNCFFFCWGKGLLLMNRGLVWRVKLNKIPTEPNFFESWDQIPFKLVGDSGIHVLQNTVLRNTAMRHKATFSLPILSSMCYSMHTFYEFTESNRVFYKDGYYLIWASRIGFPI